MAEAVRGRVRPEPPSLLNSVLYSGMNAGSWRRAGTRAGEGEESLSGLEWSEAGVSGVRTPTKLPYFYSICGEKYV